jgi:hypothetical protein
MLDMLTRSHHAKKLKKRLVCKVVRGAADYRLLDPAPRSLP